MGAISILFDYQRQKSRYIQCSVEVSFCRKPRPGYYDLRIIIPPPHLIPLDGWKRGPGPGNKIIAEAQKISRQKEET